MIKKCSVASLIVVLFFLSTALAMIPMPARIGGTLTADNIQITYQNGTDYKIVITNADGTPFIPNSQTEGLNTSNLYLIDIPIYDETDQPGGAKPGETAVIHVYKGETEFRVISPTDGEFQIGKSGSTNQIDLIVEQQVNQAPIAIAGPDQTVNEGDVVILNGSNSSDPDTDDLLTYQWSQIEGTEVLLSDDSSARPVFTAPDVGTNGESLIFELTVTDTSGLSDTDTVTVNIRYINKLPVADAGADQTVREEELVTLDGSLSSDPDDGIASYLWHQTSGTLVELSDETSIQPTFTAPEISEASEFLRFDLTVTDNGGLKSTDSVTIIIYPKNKAPVADAGEDQNVNEGELVILDGSGSYDSDNGITGYLWRQTAGTSVTLSENSGIQPTFTAPDVGINGEALIFELAVTDAEGLTHSDTVTINVRFVNHPPVADAGANQTVNEGELVSLNGSGSYDPDTSIESYLWHQTSGTVVTLSDDSAIQPTFLAPELGVNQATLTFKLTVTDSGGLIDTDSVSITVRHLNQAPVANAGADQTVQKGDKVTLDGSESYDPDGNIASYSWRQISGTVIALSNAAAVHPTFVADGVEENTVLRFELTVTDNKGLTSKDYVTINITYQNEPPVANAGYDQSVSRGDNVTLDGSGSVDTDGRIISYMWRQISGTSVNIDDVTIARTTFVAKDTDPAGEILIFELTVTDNDGLQHTDQVIITVGPENQAPVADAGEDQTVNEGGSVTLDGSASSDPEDEILSYQWRQISGTQVSLSNATITNPVFTAPDVNVNGESLTFELTVTDKSGLTDTDSVVINIRFVNQPPIADAGEDQSVSPGDRVTLDGSGSYDPDNGIHDYQWRQIQGIEMALSDPTVVQPTFIVEKTDPKGESLIFELTVTDNDGLNSSDQVTIIVPAVSQAPVADAGEDQVVEPGSLVILNGSGSYDPDGEIVSYLWIQTMGTTMNLSDSNAVRSTFTVPVLQDNTALQFELVVTDNNGIQQTDRVVINIRKMNQPPVAEAGPDQTVMPGDLVRLDGSNSADPDGSIVSYKWLQIKGTTITLSNPSAVQPTFSTKGISGDIALQFELTVTDNGGLQHTDRVTVNISAENQPPIADAGADQTVNAGDMVILDGSASYDPDDNIVSYLWIQTAGTPVTLSNPISVKTMFTTEDIKESSALRFELIVADNSGLQHTDCMTVNITGENQPPIADAGTDQSVMAGCDVILDGSASYDPENQPLSYLWRQISGTPVTLSDATDVKPTFSLSDTNPYGNVLVFELTVTDVEGLQGTDTVTVNIININTVPVADAGEIRTAMSGEIIILDGSGSYDPDSGDEIVSYKWIQTGGTQVTLSDNTVVHPTFITPYVGIENESLIFNLTVTDTGGLQDTDSVIIYVTYTNQPPIADAGNDQRVLEGTTVFLDGSNSEDSDGNIVSYFWYQTQGELVILSNPTDVQTTFVPPPVGISGITMTFELTVIDNDGTQETDEVSIKISDNGIIDFPNYVIPFKTITNRVMGIQSQQGNIVRLIPIDPNSIIEMTNRPENMIYGLIDLEVKTTSPGDTARITFYLPEIAPDGYKWYKYNSVCGWCDISNHATFNKDRDQITLTLVDGGIGDSDEIANGIIKDPSGLGSLPTSESDESEDESSSCFMAATAVTQFGFWDLLLGIGVILWGTWICGLSLKDNNKS